MNILLYFILFSNIIFSIKSFNDSENAKKHDMEKKNIKQLEILIQKYESRFKKYLLNHESIQTLLKNNRASSEDMLEILNTIINLIHENNFQKKRFEEICREELRIKLKKKEYSFNEKKTISQAIILAAAYKEISKLKIIPTKLKENNPGISEGLNYLLENHLINDGRQEEESILMILIFLNENMGEITARLKQL